MPRESTRSLLIWWSAGRAGPAGTGRRRRPEGERDPRHGDVAVHEGLAGHAMAGREIRFAQVISLAVLDRVGVLQSLLDLAFARAADAGATLEGNAALLANRGAQQVRFLRDRHYLVAIGDERDGERHQTPTSAASTAPRPASCASSARACSSVVKRGRNFDGTRFTTGVPDSSTMRICTSRSSTAMTKWARLRPQKR